jgi:hypothetical protein
MIKLNHVTPNFRALKKSALFAPYGPSRKIVAAWLPRARPTDFLQIAV